MKLKVNVNKYKKWLFELLVTKIIIDGGRIMLRRLWKVIWTSAKSRAIEELEKQRKYLIKKAKEFVKVENAVNFVLDEIVKLIKKA